MQGSVSFGISVINVGPSFDELAEYILPGVYGCQMNGSLSTLVLRVDISIAAL
jgi:hypothetical protein